MQENIVVDSVRRWVEQFVVELNLCPFAKREIAKNRVRYIACEVTSEMELLAALEAELELLNESISIETTLLIHSNVLQDFNDYNQFLDIADGLLQEMGLEGVIQIASFHPDYQFGDTEPDDAENYTNRSPYPILHLLRENSLEKAIDDYEDVENIPLRNIELMNELGVEKLKAIFKSHFTRSE